MTRWTSGPSNSTKINPLNTAWSSLSSLTLICRILNSPAAPGRSAEVSSRARQVSIQGPESHGVRDARHGIAPCPFWQDPEPSLLFWPIRWPGLRAPRHVLSNRPFSAPTFVSYFHGLTGTSARFYAFDFNTGQFLYKKIWGVLRGPGAKSRHYGSVNRSEVPFPPHNKI